DAAVVAPPGHPTAQRDGLAGVLGTQGAGFVGAEHEYRCLSVGRCSPQTARLTNARARPATGFGHGHRPTLAYCRRADVGAAITSSPNRQESRGDATRTPAARPSTTTERRHPSDSARAGDARRRDAAPRLRHSCGAHFPARATTDPNSHGAATRRSAGRAPRTAARPRTLPRTATTGFGAAAHAARDAAGPVHPGHPGRPGAAVAVRRSAQPRPRPRRPRR